MVLQADMAFQGWLLKMFHVLEFALGDARLPVVTAQFILNKLRTIEPVFDVRPVGHDADSIPLPARVRHILRRGIEVIAGAGQLALVARGVLGVVEDLDLRCGVPGRDRVVERPQERGVGGRRGRHEHRRGR